MLLSKGMSKELWKPSKLLPGLFVVLLCAFSLLSEHNLPADAYLAEDRIYYGADSYNINYKDEVINAKGNAYFRRANLSIRASRASMLPSCDAGKVPSASSCVGVKPAG